MTLSDMLTDGFYMEHSDELDFDRIRLGHDAQGELCAYLEGSQERVMEENNDV